MWLKTYFKKKNLVFIIVKFTGASSTCIPEHTSVGCLCPSMGLGVWEGPGEGVLVLTRPVQDGDVVGGEFVLAAHSDEQGAASPAETHQITTLRAPRFITLMASWKGLRFSELS